MLRFFRSKFVDVDPTDSLWTQGPNQGCSGGGWEKIGQEKSENEASKYWAAESENKMWRFEQIKGGSLRYRGPLVHWMNVDVVGVKSIFLFVAIFSLAMYFFCFQNKVAHGERNIFAYEYVVGLQRWRGYTDHLDVGLTETWMRPQRHTTAKQAIQRKNDSVQDLFVFAALGF